MHLKRLELQGFKSFATKTAFDFPEGIIGIVGPNGSGKSNVIDCMRWLLGERETKNLRGGKVDDLIFAGTDNRFRVGMAQATMTFDNSAGFFPIDAAEVAMTRKIFRDGTAQYFLNNNEARLKDIVDFFATARLGAKGFTIINQGNSDMFIRASASERRTMIEETLGLRSYQLKRHDATLKLEHTKINLEKVKAMVNELLPHLKLLRRQAARFAERATIAKKLRELENQYFGTKLKLLDDEEKKIDPDIKNLDASMKIIETSIQEAEKLVESLRGAYRTMGNDEVNKKQRVCSDRRMTLERELARAESKLELMERQPEKVIDRNVLLRAVHDIKKRLESIKDIVDIANIQDVIAACVMEIDNIFKNPIEDNHDEKNELKKVTTHLRDELEKIIQQLQGLEESQREERKNLYHAHQDFEAAMKILEERRKELQRKRLEHNELRLAAERCAMRRNELESAIVAAGRKSNEFNEAAIIDHNLEEFFVTVERQILRLRGELAAIGAIDEAMLREAKEADERYTFLNTQTEDLEKAANDLTKLVDDLGTKIHEEFNNAMTSLNERIQEYFHKIFGGGSIKLVAMKRESEIDEHAEEVGGIEINVHVPKKGIKGLDMLSGGEKSLVSIAVLFGLISLSPPPFLVFDEVDAALDEQNATKFATLLKDFSKQTQFIVVTHNRATMEAADLLYGVTMGVDGISKVLSVKLT